MKNLSGMNSIMLILIGIAIAFGGILIYQKMHEDKQTISIGIGGKSLGITVDKH